MEAGEAQVSSPNSDLSDAPTSDMEGTPIAQYLAPQPNTGSNGKGPGPAHQFASSGHLGVANHASASNAAAPATSSAPHRRNSPQVEPVKRKPRAKKESLPIDADKPKEKAKRKPRSDKGIAKNPNKKPKLEPAPDASKACVPTLSQSSLNTARKFQPQPPPSSTSTPPQPPNDAHPPSASGLTRTNVYESPKSGYKPPVSDSPTTSSNMYDPVRGGTVQRPSSSTATSQPMYQSPYNTHSQPQSPFRPGASPAISSIMNPPEPWRTSAPIQYRPDGPSHTTEPGPKPAPQLHLQASTAMDLDPPQPARVSPKPDVVSKKSPPAKETSPAPEKKQRAKEQPPPLPQGSGLLSSTLFGGNAADAANGTDKIPNIILHIDLKAKNNNIVNFARLAEEKYGFAALHPRLAAQKERLARVAAVGAALERSASGSRMGGTSAGESGDDDASVDIDADSGDDGDALMGGMNNTDGAGNSGTDGPIKKQTRKRIEEYDQEDPFVDDSELVWESQAAASKDGFFVYCGPLVPEGKEPAVERADGTVKRGRGRGRGGGVGSRGGRGASRLNGTDTGSGRATGPGSRGGGMTRKPRITKADRGNMEREKAEREKMAPIAARPPGYSNP